MEKNELYKYQQMQNAAKDLNEVLAPDPPIDLNQDMDALGKVLVEASQLLGTEPEPDIIQQNTADALQFLGVKFPKNNVDILANDKDAKTAEVEKEKPVKEKKEKVVKEKKPGVIQTIFETLSAGPATKDELLEVLTKTFPDKQADSMKNTISVQIPGRMSREKGVNIIKREDGKYEITK